MANQQLAAVAQQAIQDKGFNAWLQGIGEKGQKQIQKLFLETAKKDQKLAAMAQEDPENTMILFAYQVYKQTQKSQAQNKQAVQEESIEPEDESELEEMNYPPVSNPITAKFGSKLKYITKLNGHCPEGYEMRYYKVGGVVCGRCAKKKQLLMQSMSCGGKKRVKKQCGGGGVNEKKSFKKGGKTLTKAKAESLKYQGGPGDINSTEGMKPNKKQKKMLCKKIGGMVNNAKKITIYSQPDMFDVVH